MSQDLDLTLSRRAVAAGWEWREGVRVVGGATVTYADGVVDIVLTGDANVRRWHGEGVDPLLPDFNDAATRGVLLQQVRERWGKMVYAVPICDAETITRWLAIVPDHELPEWGWPAFEGADEVSALVAAMEAAPKR